LPFSGAFSCHLSTTLNSVPLFNLWDWAVCPSKTGISCDRSLQESYFSLGFIDSTCMSQAINKFAIVNLSRVRLRLCSHLVSSKTCL